MEKELIAIAKKHLRVAGRQLQLVGDLLETDNHEMALAVLASATSEIREVEEIILHANSQSSLDLTPPKKKKAEG